MLLRNKGNSFSHLKNSEPSTAALSVMTVVRKEHDLGYLLRSMEIENSYRDNLL